MADRTKTTSFGFRALARADLVNHVGKSSSASTSTDPRLPDSPSTAADSAVDSAKASSSATLSSFGP
eukprot:781690-Alexandrium_andersonii.AAC.1